MGNVTRYKTLSKLHNQSPYLPAKKLISLLKDVNAWNNEFHADLEKISKNCLICKSFAKTPPRPVVNFPLAHNFNEKVAMDLKSWGDKWIICLVDMWSRLTISVFNDRKTPQSAISAIMLNWVGPGYRVMKSILTDNGGEFSADEVCVPCVLNIAVCTTATNSPFQNGLCERIHAVTESMLTKQVDQCPGTSLNILLTWANVARISLQMWHGYSSYQLVFGTNLDLPNLMIDSLRTLQGATTSEILAQHLQALHESRRAFIHSEAEERIRRALRYKIRAKMNPNDRVFYNGEGHNWLGPALSVYHQID